MVTSSSSSLSFSLHPREMEKMPPINLGGETLDKRTQKIGVSVRFQFSLQIFSPPLPSPFFPSSPLSVLFFAQFKARDSLRTSMRTPF